MLSPSLCHYKLTNTHVVDDFSQIWTSPLRSAAFRLSLIPIPTGINSGRLNRSGLSLHPRQRSDLVPILNPQKDFSQTWTSPSGSVKIFRPVDVASAVDIRIEDLIDIHMTSTFDERIARHPAGKYINFEMRSLMATPNIHGGKLDNSLS